MSAYTYEIDDAETALAEIKAQLDSKITLLEHTVGVIMCHPEFIDTKVLQYICDNLPFDIVGTTNSSQSVNDEAGELMLTIFVMTSDDVRFKVGVTESLYEEVDGPIRAAYEKASAGEPEPPKLLLVFSPLLIGHYAGDVYLKAWNKIIPDTPFFGPHAIDDTAAFDESETIYNGVNMKESMSFILCYGNINPRFLIATLPPNHVISVRAEVTKATDNIVYKINNVKARKFFKEAGIAENVIVFPFLIEQVKRDDYDGIPIFRGHFSFNEDGSAEFSGDVDEGSMLSIVKADPENILASSLNEIKRINEMTDVNGVLMFSCAMRRVVLLGANQPLVELQMVRDTIKSDIPFMMGYAGSEVCPTSVNNGVPNNRYHNYTMIILVV
jgi:hypothetical protein